mmetsp:Transcript_2321/g.2542  ORF Transcript_2321/g.2542 Transcript_2321/m.2542 type:complete len:763 (+) Transcript_2321:112-2400(+)
MSTAAAAAAAATAATYNHDDDDYADDNDLGLSAMMAQAVISSTSRGREGRDEKRDLFRKEGDSNKNKRGVGRSRSRSRTIVRKMLGKKNSTTTSIPTTATATATAITMSNTRCSENDCVLTTGTNTTTTTATTTFIKNKSKNKNKVERKKSSSKKKAKKIKRKNNDDDTDDGDDDDDDTLSRRSSNSKKSMENNQNKKKNFSKQHQNKTTSSRVEAIREPLLTTEGTVIKDEMDNLFPSPKSSEKRTMTAATTTTTKTIATPTETIVSFDLNDLISTNNDNCDRVATQLDSSIRSELSIQQNSQKSNASGSGAGSNFGYGIMSNKHAEEHAEEVLNRLAAHQQMEKNNNGTNTFGSSFRSGTDGGITTTTWRTDQRSGRGGGDSYRRISSSSGSSRRTEQYQRLHRDSGLTSVDDDESCRSQCSRRSLSSNVVMSSMHCKLDDHKRENDDLQKKLSEALANVVQLSEELQFDKDRSKMAKAKICRIEKEKSFLIESIRDMERDFVAKDERIEKLQHVVETQLDTVEFLEEKLNKTEEELYLMENELDALVIVAENKVVTKEGVSDRVLNEISHASNKQGRLARMESMREDMTSRKDSIKTQKEESRRLLLSSMNVGTSSSVCYDVDKREDQLKLRELKLEAEREKYNLQEERLDKWESNLLEIEFQLKKKTSKIIDDLKTSQAKLSESKVASEPTVALCSLDSTNEELPQLDRENGEIDRLIASLQIEKEKLLAVNFEDSEKSKKMKKENEDLRMKFQWPSF